MSYRQDPRGQYNYNNYNNYNNNNYNNYNNGSGNRGEYTGGGYPQRQYSNPRNPRMIETNDGYRPSNRNPYPPNSNIIGSAQRGQTADDDDDNASVGSSVYSQPSVMGAPSRSYQEQSLETTEPRRYQEQYLETTEPRRYQEQYLETTEPRFYQEQSLETTEPRRYQEQYFNEYDPPSPLAASTNTHNSSTGLTTGSQQDQNQNERAYNTDNMDHQNTQMLDVYNDFNNNNNYRSDDEDGSRYNTLTGDGYDSNPYTMNADYNKDLSGNGKGAGNRLSMSGGDHYVVTSEKKRRCAICSRKTCVITTFIVLVILAAGMYFVWPRIPNARFLSSSPVGNPEITTTPAAVKMQMDLEFELDNRENWLPYKFKLLDLEVFSADDANRPIAKGSKEGFSIPGRAKSTVTIPITVDYSGSAPNDQILQSFNSACTQSANGVKTTLNLIVKMKMFILGLDWVKKPIITLPLLNFQCPFSTPQNTPAPPPAEQPPAPPTGQPPAGGVPPAGAPAPAPAPPAGGAPAGGAPPTGGAPAGGAAPPTGGAPAGGAAPPTGGVPAGGAAPPAGGAPPDGAPADGAPPPAGGVPAPPAPPAGGAPAGGVPAPAPPAGGADGQPAADPAAEQPA